MSEQTPEFGGLRAGRAAGSGNRIDAASDRLENEINRFADSLAKFTSQMDSARSGMTGGGQQARSGNGGQVSFSGGAHAGQGPVGQAMSAVGSKMPSSYPWQNTDNAHRAPGPATGFTAGNMAKAAGIGVLGAATIYGASHYGSQFTGATLAQMYGGADWETAFRRGMTGNYTAHGNKDFFATVSMMGQRSGSTLGSDSWRGMMSQVSSMSAVNPAMSNQAAATSIMGAASVGTTNRLNALGINPLNAAGKGDPRSIARQILSRMNSQRVRTRAQADAAFAPNGSATVTLDNYAMSGYLPAGVREGVESEMRRILYAQVAGMEYEEYNRLATQSAGGGDAAKSARHQLNAAGISTDTPSQRVARASGRSRDTEAETIGGFVKGLAGATEVLGAFRRVITGILEKVPGAGELTGLFGGFNGTLPIPGLGGGGDGPTSMSAYATNYSHAAGSAKAGPGFGTAGSMGVINARAGSGSVGSAAAIGNRYSLGAVKPWVAKAAGILGPKFGIKTIGGIGQRSYASDHPKGLALDFMCSKSAGDSLAAYAVANHKQLNITYVIWRQRIWSINHPGWRAMEDRGSPTANHMDHVHVSFLASPTNGDFGGMVDPGGSLGSAVTEAVMGRGGSTANLATAGTGSGFSAAGGFSETAALGLGGSGYGMATVGSSGGGGGGGGISSGMPGSSGVGGGGGRNYNYGGAGGPGSLRVGSFNMLFTNGVRNTAEDFKKISGKVDVLGWQELDKNRAGPWARYMRNNTDWGHYQSKYGDTAVSWNEDKYRALQRGSYDEIDSVRRGTNAKVRRGSAYVLLQDKNTGAKFWVVSSHLQAHRSSGAAFAATQDKQIQQIAALYARLRKTGIPVVSVGDFNNRNPGHARGAERFGRGIDQIYAGGGDVVGGGSMGGTNSDHPFVWANINLPGGKSSGNGGSPAQNMALGRSLAASRGWTGAQWNALQQLWMRESGWRTNADNPSSSAYGIPQALTALHGLGDKYKSDPRAQILWGLNYIAQRYGDPASAWKFWQQKGYYRSGTYDVKQDENAQVHQGEMILNAMEASAVRSAMAGSRRRGGGSSVVFQPGAIVVQVQGGSIDKKTAETGAKMIVDAVVENERFKALAEGV